MAAGLPEPPSNIKKRNKEPKEDEEEQVGQPVLRRL